MQMPDVSFGGKCGEDEKFEREEDGAKGARDGVILRTHVLLASDSPQLDLYL